MIARRSGVLGSGGDGSGRDPAVRTVASEGAERGAGGLGRSRTPAGPPERAALDHAGRRRSLVGVARRGDRARYRSSSAAPGVPLGGAA